MTGPDPLLLEAAELGVPWREILEAEIRAERILHPFLAGSQGGPPLDRMLALLPSTALESWRIREAIERLSWQARTGSENGCEARGELRAFAAYLAGRCPRMPPAAIRAHHFLLAYRRVQELLRICRRAARSRGTEEERVAAVDAKTRCGEPDARWAVRREAEHRSHRLDDAVRRARAEGFEIPRGRDEPEAFLRIRAFLERRAMLEKNGAPAEGKRLPARPSGRGR